MRTLPRFGFALVLLSIAVDTIGVGLVAPLLPLFLRGMDVSPEKITFCIALYPATMLISAPLWGRLSDAIGRVPVIAVGLAGSAAGFLVLARAESLEQVAAARILGGAMAGCRGAAYALAADSTTGETRERHVGYTGAAAGFGFLVGPIIGSWLGGDSDSVDLELPAGLAAIVSLLVFLGVALFLRSPGVPSPSIPRSPGLSWTRVGPVLICAALYHFAGGSYESVFPIWAAERGIVRSARDLMPMMLSAGVSFVIIQMVAIRPLASRFRRMYIVSISSLVAAMAAGLMIVMRGSSSPALFSAIFALIAATSAITITFLQIEVSELVDERERGSLLGIFTSVGILGRTAATFLSGLVFARVGSDAPYALAIVICIILACYSTRLGMTLRRRGAPGSAVGRAGI
jgi:MFS family permease